MDSVFVATVSTRHFDFVAIGETEKAASAALRRAFSRHIKDYGGTEAQAVEMWRAHMDSVCISEIPMGGATRDGFAV